MATKEYPILRGLIGLILALILFFLFVVILSSFFIGGKGEFSISDKIAVVPIKGVITDSQTIIDQLNKFKKHRKVKAILLRIDSPGGGVGPAQEIYQEIKKIRKVKKVVSSIGSIGASGGYYVACAADKIVANPGTITGSIGVIVEYANLQKLLEKIGLKGIVIKSGKYKDIMSPLRDITEDERSLIQNVVNDIHNQFVSAIAEARHLEKAQVEAIADGRIFTGIKAKELGLIDELGNFNDAVKIAAEMVGIKGEPELIYPEKKFSFLDYFLEKAFQKWEEILFFPYQLGYLLPIDQ
ncbi:MAG: signal peptide peptidase SppA [Deltaproteobacteria bacterium]|nr:MAG: signal peptide peptidase SppA [Deltaproteobacteria bacterium]